MLEKLFVELAKHIKKHSPDLKSVNPRDCEVCIADRHPQINGSYFQIDTESDTDEAWYSIFQRSKDFEVVTAIRGLGWRTVIIWIPNLKWEQRGIFFKDKPKCDWRSPIWFLRLPEPEDSKVVSRLGKTFYHDRNDDVYYVNSDNVIIRYHDDNVKVLDFCLERGGLVPKKIISTEEIIIRDCLNNWIYNVEFENGGDKVSARVVYWRKTHTCEWI